MNADFDLALGLLRSTPPVTALNEGQERLVRNIQSMGAFKEDLDAIWSPMESLPCETEAFLSGWAPITAIAPIWLSRMARPAAAEGPLEGILYQLYCRSLDQPEHGGRRTLVFFHTGQYHPLALNLCIDLLTLRHLPRRFLPEIIGVTLAHTSMDLTGIPNSDRPHRLACESLQKAMALGLDLDRIRQGFALYQSAALKVFSNQHSGEKMQSHRDGFAHIVATKASAALGYHAKVWLQDRSLDAWLETHGTHPEPILRALEASPLIDRACPFGSRLIKAMDFGGPMFGVFDANERAVAGQWIKDPEGTSSVKPLPNSTKVKAAWREEDRPVSAPKSKGIRDLFHRLVSAENPTELPDEGRKLILRVLRRTSRLQKVGLLPKPFLYQPSRLDQFLNERHAAALRKPKRRFFSKSLSRDYWRWILTQLSPAVLVDGAWLSGVAVAPSQLQPWHLELIKIHEDELGNGDPVKNHPRIYRRLLESLNIHLPDIADPNFADEPSIHPAAFTFPSFMVAMGWHYSTFEPECLGLNLAIELSGLGAGYQEVIESMRQVRIDPLIAELHLSIDNLSSGHARRAQNAIELYLESIAQTEGSAAEQAAWERIYRGFLSYRIALGYIGVLILIRYLISGNLKNSK